MLHIYTVRLSYIGYLTSFKGGVSADLISILFVLFVLGFFFLDNWKLVIGWISHGS